MPKKKHRICFIVPKETFTPIITKGSAEAMNLLTLNNENFKSVNSVTVLTSPQEQYPDLFSCTLGKIPFTVHLDVDQTIAQVICPPRRIPVSMKKKVQNVLEEMMKKGIIE